MNILFLTISGMPKYEKHDIYSDVLFELIKHGHNVYAISANQKRNNKQTELSEEMGIHALRVKTGNITQCGIIEKGISTVLIKYQYKKSIKKYFSDIKFDLILYATPPITVADVVKYVKKRDNAKSYLMLKDIFPQNAIDLGILNKKGIKGIIYRHFKREEKKLYMVSDRIGCMSPANVSYVINNNSYLQREKVELFPNCLEPLDLRVDENVKKEIRKKYNIPQEKKVFVYGGNLGLPQGIPSIIESIREASKNTDAFFLIVGNGTEYNKIQSFIDDEKIENVVLMNRIPKEDYDVLVAACDVGLIFLDHRFTIPNFPSRLLSYLQAGLPIISSTDPNTDVGTTAQENGFGWSCESNNPVGFARIVSEAIQSDCDEMGKKGYDFMINNYSVCVGYNKLEKLMNER